MTELYDFIVIGGGSAGYAGAVTAAQLGLKTLVVEGGAEVGGLCILRGCMPSKTLLESGHRAEAIREAAGFGIDARFLGVNGATIRERKRRLIAEFADYRREQLEKGRFDFVRGTAAFVDPHTIDIGLLDGGLRRVTGRAFLIATGSKIHCVPLAGLEETGFWTSDEVLDAERVPASVVVLGGGSIALEVASFYAGVGSQVTVVQRSPQVLKELDADLAAAVVEGLEKRGVAIIRDTCLLRVERDGDLKRVIFGCAGEERSATGEEIIVALGRVPNIAELALERAGVSVARGLPVSDTQQCGAPHLFAAGDASGPHEVVHIAIQQAEIAARNAARTLHALGGDLERMDYALKLFAVFTHPEVAAVGLSERECTAQGIDFISAKYLYADHGKALVRGATSGFVKLIAERDTRRLIGGACIGLEASELIHEIVVAMRFGATAAQLAGTPHYHPTLSEIWTYPADELANVK